MRCLYCGKELALLKRLTGGGEFCSDTHKHSYQEEYDRLGLSRLLQAQAKTVGAKALKNAPPQKTAAPVTAPVAVAVAVAERVEEEVVETVRTHVAVKRPATAPEPVREQENPAIESGIAEPEESEPEFTPPDIAGYLAPKMTIAFMPPNSLYVERWVDSAV